MNTIELINEMTRQVLDLVADKYHKLFHNEIDENEYDRRLLDRFADRFYTGSLICDAGCGPSAHVGKYLYGKGLKVTGVDFCQRCIELASDINPEIESEIYFSLFKRRIIN
jgi:2-polyprenyl-3-methyl-5-hydroxy-6-metoxy-1,4-benzoquinol methylase